MSSYRTSTIIRAARDRIWAVLTDAARYPEWNPTVIRLEGSIAAGKRIKVFADISPERAFPVTVTEFVPGERMVWTGGFPFGVFKGLRTFVLGNAARGQTQFTMHEVFSGLLAPLITRSMPDLTESFERFAAALKAEAEKTG
jgi:hypothetical protein